MDAKISSIVLGVEDLQRSIHFYKDGLGLPLGYLTESIAFFELRNIKLVLFIRRTLSQESHVAYSKTGIPPVSLVHQVESEGDVDAIVNRAIAFGARLTRPASKTCYDGYSAYFCDPEGFLWEIVWDPNTNPN